MTIRAWIHSLRAFSFTGTLVPVLLVAALALSSTVAVQWWFLLVFLVAALLFHAATNVLNDYYDYRAGVDRADDPDPTHAITAGHVQPRFMLVSGHVYFVLALLLGLLLARERGPWFLAAGIAGSAASYFYTAGPWSLKYRALGDITVFAMMGPGLVAMGYWALTGDASSAVVAASVPIGLLITAVLHGNNLRDIAVDRSAGVKTLAGLLGFRASQRLFAAEVFSAYVITVVLVFMSIIPVWSLGALITIPLALRIVQRVQTAADGRDIIDLPVRCAALHAMFGVVYAAGVLVPGLAA